MPQKAYWLWPDGRTELVEFPSDIGDPQPSRLGIAYRGTASEQSKNGIYQLSNGKRQLLVRGYVTEMAMSPDGCRLAFAHAPEAKSNVSNSRNVSRRTLKAVELCIGGLVRPAQQLMFIAPSDYRAEVEAILENRDVRVILALPLMQVEAATVRATRRF